MCGNNHCTHTAGEITGASTDTISSSAGNVFAVAIIFKPHIHQIVSIVNQVKRTM